MEVELDTRLDLKNRWVVRTRRPEEVGSFTDEVERSTTPI